MDSGRCTDRWIRLGRVLTGQRQFAVAILVLVVDCVGPPDLCFSMHWQPGPGGPGKGYISPPGFVQARSADTLQARSADTTAAGGDNPR